MIFLTQHSDLNRQRGEGRNRRESAAARVARRKIDERNRRRRRHGIGDFGGQKASRATHEKNFTFSREPRGRAEIRGHRGRDDHSARSRRGAAAAAARGLGEARDGRACRDSSELE